MKLAVVGADVGLWQCLRHVCVMSAFNKRIFYSILSGIFKPSVLGFAKSQKSLKQRKSQNDLAGVSSKASMADRLPGCCITLPGLGKIPRQISERLG